MDRRTFIALVSGAALWSPAAGAQQKVIPVIGFLSAGVPNLAGPVLAAFGQGLRETGYAEGQNLAIEYRWAEGHYDRLPGLAADLVERKVQVLAVTGGTPTAKGATSTIPSSS